MLCQSHIEHTDERWKEGSMQKGAWGPVQASMPSAVEAARRELQAVDGRGIICVTGSLHAVAEALSTIDLQAQA